MGGGGPRNFHWCSREEWFDCILLHLAANSGRASCVETLVKLGSNIDATESDGWSTPNLSLGLSNDSSDMLEILQCNGAHPKAPMLFVQSIGQYRSRGRTSRCT